MQSISIQQCANTQHIGCDEAEHIDEATNVLSNSSGVNQNSVNPSHLDHLYASLLFDEVNRDLIENEINCDLIVNESTSGESATTDNLHDTIEKDHDLILKTILEQKSQTICKSQLSKFNICRKVFGRVRNEQC